MLAYVFIATALAVPVELNTFPMLSTHFDGTTFESTLAFAQLQPSDSITLPLSNCQQVGSPQNFAFKFWFKATELNAQLLSFPLSVACYTIAAPFSVYCTTPNHSQLKAVIDDFVAGKWYYFALTVSDSGQARLLIFDNTKLISSDKSEDFYFTQTQPANSVCLGNCNLDEKLFNNGVTGGIREVVAVNNDESFEVIVQNKHRILSYNNKVKGYYRFSMQDPRMFYLEQFREWPANTTALPVSIMAPITTCPNSLDTANILQFTPSQSVKQAKLSQKLKQTQYTYTMSVTMLVNSNVCITDDFKTAADGCNLIMLDEVFMMYFSRPNAARFHFNAYRNYYESQSNNFFIPYNQWITVQLMITQLDGFQVVVLDAQGQVLINFARSQNMQQQSPTGTYKLFSGFSGMVSRIVLSDLAYHLPAPVSGVIDQSTLIDLSFIDITDTSILTEPALKSTVPFFALEFNQTVPIPPAFDGIACQNRIRALTFQSQQSSFEFNTSAMQNWMSQTSINFWFRISDWSQVNGLKALTQSILTMIGKDDTDSYWLVFIRNGQLIVAPFGLATQQEPQIFFTTFGPENSDPSGWWHLTCNYQFYASAKCTLENQKVHEVLSQPLLALQQYFFPQYSLQVIFGKNKFFNGVKGLQLKEVSYFNRTIIDQEQQVILRHQLDPQTFGLLNYFRLSTLQDYANNSTVVLNNDLAWQPEYQIVKKRVYSEQSLSFITKSEIAPFVICPLGTYYKNNKCFSNPVQQPKLIVFPTWNTTSSKLDWIVTVNQSSFLSTMASQQLSYQWQSSDSSLMLRNVARQFVPQTSFKQQTTYTLAAQISNSLRSFESKPRLTFTPNSCKWFEVYLSDASTSYAELLQLPGQKDYSFKLVLKQNPSLPCQYFPMYDTFQNITFEFFINDGEYFIADQPNVTYSLQSASVTIANPTSQPLSQIKQASDLSIYVTIPAKEQLKLPVWKKVKLLMSFQWSNSSIFQHAMQTIQFNPQGTYLQVNLTQNYFFVSKFQTFIVSAENSTVSGLQPGSVKDMFSYQWICPVGFEVLCQGQSTERLFVPWNMLAMVNMTYSTLYTFNGQVTWARPDGTNETRSSFVTVQWYDLQPPKFQLAPSQNPILVTSTVPIEFSLNGTTFNATDDLSIYNITWSSQPPISPQFVSFVNNKLVLATGSLQQNTYYTIFCSMVYKWEASINGTAKYSFQTTGPPQNGNVLISPQNGYLGDRFNITLINYTDSSSAVYYNVYESLDGKTKGNKINKKLLNSSWTFPYIANTSNPIIVEVVNLKGEQVNVVLTPWIVQKPPQECDTIILCSSPKDNSTGPPEPSQPNGPTTQRLQAVATNVTTGNKTVSTVLIDGCSYITTCIQPQFDFTQQRPNATTGTRRLEKQSCEDLSIDHLQNRTSIEEMFSLFNQSLDTCILDTILKSTTDPNIITQVIQTLHSVTDYLSTNIQIVLMPLDQQNTTIKALDSEYQVTNLLSQFDDQQELTIRATAVRGADQYTTVEYFVSDSNGEVIFLKDLDGQINIKFLIEPTTYRPGQTVCQGLLPDIGWTSDVCLTELNVASKLATCTCSLTHGVTLLAFKPDLSLKEGAAIDFPQEQQVAELKGTSMFFVGLVLMIWGLGVIGSVVTMKMDRQPAVQNEKAIVTVQAVVNKIHPLVAPFTGSISTQSRLLRFSAYYLQINCFVVGLMINFGQDYRKNDRLRNIMFIDQADISQITGAAVIGAIMLLPIVSVPVCQMLSDELVIENSQQIVKRRRVCPRSLFLLVCQVVSCLPLIGAYMICEQSPTANQYALASAIFGGLFLATVGSNMLRAFFNTYVAVPYVTSAHVRQMKCKKSIKADQKLENSVESEQIFQAPPELRFYQTEQKASSGQSLEIEGQKRGNSIV